MLKKPPILLLRLNVGIFCLFEFYIAYINDITHLEKKYKYKYIEYNNF